MQYVYIPALFRVMLWLSDILPLVSCATFVVATGIAVVLLIVFIVGAGIMSVAIVNILLFRSLLLLIINVYINK